VREVLLRASGLVVGAVSAYAALYVVYMPILLVITEAEWQKTHPANYFNGVLWFGGTGIVAALLGWFSYASFRYAIRPHPQTAAN
jgi:hypothetical protein